MNDNVTQRHEITLTLLDARPVVLVDIEGPPLPILSVGAEPLGVF